MRRGRMKRTRRRGVRGDWICTNGAMQVELLDPGGISSPTIGEFELITPGEVAEHTDKLLLQRVVGYFYILGPYARATNDSGILTGCMTASWGVRVAPQNELGQVLPFDPNNIDDMDSQWLFLRRHEMGAMINIGSTVPWMQLPMNLNPQLGTGGRHAPQGGPSIDINVKRKLTGRDSLLLSLGIQPGFTNTGGGTDSMVVYAANDVVQVSLHIRCFVTALG